MRPASRLLLLEAELLPPLLETATEDEFSRPTLCPGWSVRDVVAHCGEALASFANGTSRTFTPEENQAEVDLRSAWPFARVLDELTRSYGAAADLIEDMEGTADGLALGEWIHGGDIRHALQRDDAFASPDIDIAIPLISERSMAKAAPRVHVLIDGTETPFGVGEQQGELTAGVAAFVRLISGRRPDRSTFELSGVDPERLVLYA